MSIKQSRFFNFVIVLALLSFLLPNAESADIGFQASRKVLLVPGCSDKPRENKHASLQNEFTQIETAKFKIYVERGSVYEGSEPLSLKSGSFMVVSKKTLFVETPNAHIELPKGALAIVRIGTGNTRVLSLANRISVRIHKDSYCLEPCGMVYVTAGKRIYAYEFSGEFMLQLRLVRSNFGSENSPRQPPYTATMYFDFMDACVHEPLLRQLWQSKAVEDLRLQEKMYKESIRATPKGSRYAGYLNGVTGDKRKSSMAKDWWRGLRLGSSLAKAIYTLGPATLSKLDSSKDPVICCQPEELPKQPVSNKKASYRFQGGAVEVLTDNDWIYALSVNAPQPNLPATIMEARCRYGDLYVSDVRTDGIVEYRGYGIKVLCDPATQPHKVLSIRFCRL